MTRNVTPGTRAGLRQRGASLVVVMVVLLIVTVIGIAGARLALLGEMSARHDRDTQIAFEAAEAAVMDAESDIDREGALDCASLRPQIDLSLVPEGSCLTSTTERGLCGPAPSSTAKPTWASVDFLDNSSTAPTVQYGSFTCRAFASGAGMKPERPPRYLIEWDKDMTPGFSADGADLPPLYRITAMGFGPRLDTRAVIQVEYRSKKANK
jgi:type IV pilus assembly protein PilX